MIENKERKNYYDSLDFVKGIAIILVIIGHCIQCGSGKEYYESQLFFDNGLFKFIYSFHMPLFMMISGFLFGRTNDSSLFATLKNKTVRLLLPVFFWQTIMMVLSLLRGKPFQLNGYFISLIDGFWFLWSVWWATIICKVISCVFKTGRIRMVAHLILILLSFITPDGHNFSLHKYMYICFLLGLIAAKRNFEVKKLNNKTSEIMLLLIMSAVYLGLFVLFNDEAYIYISGWTVLGKDSIFRVLFWDVYRVAVGSLGSAIIIYISYIVIPSGYGKIVKDLGKSSCGIYIMQTYFIVLMMKGLPNVRPNNWINILEGIIICVSCYTIEKVLVKIPFLSEIMFGQKFKVSERDYE